MILLLTVTLMMSGVDFQNGSYYSATIFGNGDFTHHQANFEFIK